MQWTGIPTQTTQQYGLWKGPGPGAECKILASGDNLELIQFELGPDEGLANLWKSYRPKTHLILALVIYSKVTDSSHTVSVCRLEHLALYTLRIPTAVNGRSVCVKSQWGWGGRQGHSSPEKEGVELPVKNLYTMCSQLLDRYNYQCCLFLYYVLGFWSTFSNLWLSDVRSSSFPSRAWKRGKKVKSVISIHLSTTDMLKISKEHELCENSKDYFGCYHSCTILQTCKKIIWCL